MIRRAAITQSTYISLAAIESKVGKCVCSLLIFSDIVMGETGRGYGIFKENLILKGEEGRRKKSLIYAYVE